MTEHGKTRFRISRWVFVLVLLIGVPLAVYVIADAVGRGRVRRAEERWAAAGLSFDQLRARYPDSPADDAARRVEKLSARLGISMVPKTEPQPALAAGYAGKVSVHDMLERELSSESGTPEQAPAEIAAFIDAHATEVDDLVIALSDGGVPRWASETSKGEAAPIPNLLGHSRLQRLLAAVALHRAAEGRDDDALRALDASWTLNQSLFERPELISRIIAVGAAKGQVGALRKLDSVPASWDERLRWLNARELIHESAQWEAGLRLRPMLDTSASSAALGQPSPRDRAMLRIIRPYLLATAADNADRLRALLEADRAVAPCIEDAAALGARLPPSAPWNVFEPGHYPAILNRAARLSFDAELTRQVLRARAERTPRVASGPCPDWTFTTEVSADGRLTVSYAGPPVIDPSTGYLIPVRWVEGR